MNKPGDLKITKDMMIMEMLEKFPETLEVVFEYGIHCAGCGMSEYETIEQGAAVHGIDPDELLADLNELVSS